jgi:hypothetical protein
MQKQTSWALSLALVGVIAGAGCGSSSLFGDGGTNDTGGGDGVTLFGLTTGDSCFDVTSVSGVTDGCMLSVGSLVGSALLVNYVMSTATLTVGTGGSLGGGPIAFNMGTLMRDGDTSDSAMPLCTWHQTDTSNVTVTATNEFDIAVTEVENTFSTACATSAPAGGTCTSTWTWHMKKGTKTAPACN